MLKFRHCDRLSRHCEAGLLKFRPILVMKAEAILSQAALLQLSFRCAVYPERSEGHSYTFGNSIRQKNFNSVGMLVSSELNLILNLVERQQLHKQSMCLK